MTNKLKLIQNVFISNFKRLTSPYKVTFALTYKCNLRCRICRIWEKPHREELDSGKVEKIFKSLYNLNWLDLTGGEVTIRQDLIEIIKLIIKNAKRLSILHVTTNGGLPDKVFLLAKEILKFDTNFLINISIDGPKGINAELKGNEDAYLNSIETFKLLKSLKKGYCYFSCTLSDYNIEYVDGFVSELKKDLPYLTPADLHFNVFHKSNHFYNNQNINGLSYLNLEKLKKYFRLSKNGNFIKQFLAGRYAKGLFKYLKGDKFPLRCQALRNTCFINPYGEVYPCVIYDRLVGDLKEYNYNLNELWSRPHLLTIRNDIENRMCSGCWTPCEAYPAILGNLFLTGRNASRYI